MMLRGRNEDESGRAQRVRPLVAVSSILDKGPDSRQKVV